jgi:hypothetical protein
MLLVRAGVIATWEKSGLAFAVELVQGFNDSGLQHLICVVIESARHSLFA